MDDRAMTIPAPTRHLVTIDRRRFYERARSRWLRPVPDGLLRLAAHASAADALVRSNHALAAGAATVAAIVALRLAATSSTEAESTAKWDAIRATTLLLRSPAADRFGRLCDVALECETRRARAGDITIRSRERLVEVAGSEFGHAPGPIALDFYADVLWFRGSTDSVSGLVADVTADARELDSRGFVHATEGAEAYLCDVALGLCVGASTRARGVIADVLDSLRPAARGRPVVLAVIDAALTASPPVRGGPTT